MLQIAVELVAAIDVNDDGMYVNYACSILNLIFPLIFLNLKSIYWFIIINYSLSQSELVKVFKEELKGGPESVGETIASFTSMFCYLVSGSEFIIFLN